MLDRITFTHWIFAKGAVTLAVLAALALNAWGGYKAPRSHTAATPPAATYSSADAAERGASYRKAALHCSRYDGAARLRSMNTAEDGNTTVIFECVGADAYRVGV